MSIYDLKFRYVNENEVFERFGCFGNIPTIALSMTRFILHVSVTALDKLSHFK
jgi:hypothetical protein